MLLAIADVLTAAEVAQVRDSLALMAFEDGRVTAGWNARLVKKNHQASASAALDKLRASVSAAILRHPVFDLAVRPKALTPLLFSRTGMGEGYGTHVDSAAISGMRTDVSFTLFLTDPGSYEGGELVIESAAGEDAHKLAAGHMFVYPSTTLHRVETVTRGERLAAVGWARSTIRRADDRELLFDLDTARRQIFEQHGKTPEFDLLSKCLTNLLRQWMED